MLASALAAVAVLVSPAVAAPEGAGPRLGLGLGWFQPGANESVVDGTWTVVPRGGYSFNRTFALEADIGYAQGTTRAVGRLFHVVDPRLNLLVHAPELGPLTLFGAVGPGLYWKKVERSEDSDIGTGDYDSTNQTGYGGYKNPDLDFLFNIGPGALISFGDGPVGLRTDFRYMLSLGGTPSNKDDDVRTLEADAYDNWEWTVGLNVAFGGPKDSDGDGIVDDDDQCVDDAEDVDGYRDADGCPDEDNDGDQVADTVDDCPDDPEDRDGWQDEDGCEDPDNDDDGVLDDDDSCPVEAGSAATQGCPDSDGDGIEDAEDDCPTEAGPASAGGCPDRDGDRVPDNRDACPDEPIDARADPSRSDGCPAQVVVTDQAVVILDKVYFATNRATIKAMSYAILDEVAAVLVAYPDIRKVEVAGHTDSDGPDQANLELSQRRAQAVVDYIVRKGVEPERLVAKGYGESVPIADNATRDGKANNRRVEFTIVEQ